MYLLILGLGLALAGFLFYRGVVRARAGHVAAGVLAALGTLLFFGLMSFWAEALWFQELGYSGRFWRMVITRVLVTSAGALVAAGLVYALSRERWAAALGAALGVAWWLPGWHTVLPYLYSSPTGQHDPIFGRDLRFFLFELPLYDSLVWFLIVLTILAICAIGARLAATGRGREEEVLGWAAHPLRRIWLPAGVLALLTAALFVLAPFHLLLSTSGIVHGAGWTDVWIRRPAYYVAAGVALLVAIVLLASPLRRRREATGVGLAAVGSGAIALVWAVGVWLLPGLFQWLKVTPSEITVERPYIAHNIAFTRSAFGLESIENRQFPVANRLEEAISQNQHILSEIRLWDPRALADVYGQFQEIRLYYEMDGIDIDRYQLGDRYRQVMVAAREMQADNLPASSRTFVNTRFKYTHGHGLAMSPVSEFRLEGLPEMFLKDLPPVAAFPELRIDRPEIYFGERTHEHVIANSREKEFDYPSGSENVYAHYEGRGGVAISNFWRRLIYGWKFDGTRLLVSTYLRPESRVLFRRQIEDRVKALAPFLSFDQDPYIVVAEGRLFWIIDGYSTSRRYPYSEPFSPDAAVSVADEAGPPTPPGMTRRTTHSLAGSNYVRNSVKAVVDAYNGTVDFYVFVPDDPIVKAWSGAFPGLFKPRSQMPPALEQHVRYPEGLLLAQSLVYAKYHMTDPEVFYNQEDLWVRATEKYIDQIQPVDPYYIMWEPTGSERAEFILMQPFTPRNRQVLIGWLAGMCDPPNYGRLLAYHFPKDKRVLGTQQVDTKIDQDPNLSAQLTWWSTEGKRVIRGNVLVIPISDTLLYVEPIYIQAEVAAYPELRMVVVMHNDHMSYAPTFAEAMELLVEPAAGDQPVVRGRDAAIDPQAFAAAEEEFTRYLDALAAGRFAEAGQHLERLRQIFQDQGGQPQPTR